MRFNRPTKMGWTKICVDWSRHENKLWSVSVLLTCDAVKLKSRCSVSRSQVLLKVYGHFVFGTGHKRITYNFINISNAFVNKMLKTAPCRQSDLFSLAPLATTNLKMTYLTTDIAISTCNNL